MKNKWLINPQDIQIQGLLDRYMRSQTSSEILTEQVWHLDEDSLAAFVEGKLGESETKPIIKHLVDCSFCRHITAELIKLDLAFAEQEFESVPADANQPSRISEVLSSLLSRIFGANDGAVFAHQEQDETLEETEDKKKKEK